MTTPFKKTQKQIEATRIQSSSATHCMLFGGSRSGKTFQNVRSVIVRALLYPRSRHLIARNTLKSVKTAILMDTMPKVIDLCFPSLASSFALMNKTQVYWQLPNLSQIYFGGIGNPEDAEKILGTEYLTIFFNEVSELSYRSILKVRTRLAQNIKGAALKIYYDCNPPNRGHWAYKEFIEHVNPNDDEPQENPEDFVSLLMNPTDNIINLPADYIKQLNALPEHERNRFLLGLWSDDILGSVFSSALAAIDDHIGDHPHNPNYPVYTGWDIGVRDDTAIWFYQVIEGKLYFIDCYSNNFYGLPHYIEVLKNKPYKYAIDFYPHDGANTEWAWGKSRRAIATGEYGRDVVVLPRLAEADQVSLTRSILPRCYFDKKNCLSGLNALRFCRYEYNEKLGNFKNTSMLHDEYSHLAKAFIYSCMGYDKRKSEIRIINPKESEKLKQEKIEKTIKNFVTDQLVIDEL